MLIDLHTHTLPASRDAFDDVGALAEALAKLEDVHAVALTDHGPGCDFAAAERLLAGRGLLLIPGREVNTPLGHVLVLSADATWLAGLPERCPLPLPSEPASPPALVWAHPAGWRVAGATLAPDPSRGAEFVHAVEVLNGERLWQPDGVTIAEGLAADLGAGATGGSDAHRVASAGRCLTRVEATTVAGVIEEIRAGRCEAALGRGWAIANDHRYFREDLARYAWPGAGPAR